MIPLNVTRSSFICSLCIWFIKYNAIESLICNIDNLRANCLLHDPDIVCIVESWLDSDIENSELHISGYQFVRHDRFGCDQKQFIVYLVHQVYCIHCGTTAEKGTSEVFVSLQPRMPAWWSALLLQLTEFTPVGGNCKVYLPDKGPGAYELPKVVECSTVNFYMY